MPKGLCYTWLPDDRERRFAARRRSLSSLVGDDAKMSLFSEDDRLFTTTICWTFWLCRLLFSADGFCGGGSTESRTTFCCRKPTIGEVGVTFAVIFPYLLEEDGRGFGWPPEKTTSTTSGSFSMGWWLFFLCCWFKFTVIRAISPPLTLTLVMTFRAVVFGGGFFFVFNFAPRTREYWKSHK